MAHGTRDPDGMAAVHALCARVSALRPGLPVRLGCVSSARPSLTEALAGVSGEVVVVPLLLAPGHHVRVDIPHALSQAPWVRARVAPALGPDPLLAEALTDRLTEAERTRSADPAHPTDPGGAPGTAAAAGHPALPGSKTTTAGAHRATTAGTTGSTTHTAGPGTAPGTADAPGPGSTGARRAPITGAAEDTAHAADSGTVPSRATDTAAGTVPTALPRSGTSAPGAHRVTTAGTTGRSAHPTDSGTAPSTAAGTAEGTAPAPDPDGSAGVSRDAAGIVPRRTATSRGAPPARTPVVLAAAGSADPGARAAIRATAALLAARTGRTVFAAFLSGAGPAPCEVVAALRAAGHDDVVVASCLLGSGAFARLAAGCGARVVSAPLGGHEAVARLVLRRYDEAAARTCSRKSVMR
ncbi:CbiX/SirB N-terminal domain-containing protein [Streptomyces gamaensis]|uniref:CbiX/SirB N-terminal domain-containing protein n=1 Tax=Streptomyces gamaensis TaxID=1763542 RepID=A0ABW0YYL4_9ACTN